MSDHIKTKADKGQSDPEAAPVYIEPGDYIPIEIRKELKLGEFADDEQTSVDEG